MNDILNRLQDLADLLAGKGLRTVKTDDMWVVVFDGAIEIKRLNAENALLREALRPFAKAGELFCGGDEHLDMLIYDPAAGDEYRIFGNDLRRARAAIEESESKP